MPNATANLNLAISTGDSSYDPSQAVTYIWNEARWALAEESIVLSSIEAAVTQAQAQYAQEYASKRLSTSTISRNSTLNAMNPIQATALNLYSFSIGIKPFINTVGFVFPGLIQFFFAMALGGISAKTHIHRLSPVRSYLIRFIISRIWTFMIAISWAGWFYTFAEGRTGAASSYILMALDMWMYTMISFEFHDSCAAFIPIEFLPITVLSWVIINVTAAAFPIALKPVFYHIDYAIPSFNCFEIFVTILTGGAANRLYRNLPVLFAWMIIAGAVGVAANLKRCHLAQVTARKYEKHDITSDLGNGEGITKPADQKEDTVENMFSREALG